MPRSIVQIPVDDEQFSRFLKNFQAYKDQLAKMPAEWKKVDDAVKSVADTFATHKKAGTLVDFGEGAVAALELAEAMGKAQVSAEATGTAVSKTAVNTRTTSRVMADMVRSGKSIAGSFVHATAELTKWAALSAGAGLLGGGGLLWGIDRLADSVGGQRRGAQGLGISYGEQSAFGLTLGRLVDPSILQNVQGARGDLSQQWRFTAGLGITAGQFQNDDNAQLSVDVIRQARSLWQQAGPNGHTSQFMQAHGLDAFMSLSDWQRIGQTSTGEFNSDIAKYNTAASGLNVPDPMAQKWQDFSQQLATAGKQIENVFITGLVPLLGPLSNLSAAVVKDLQALLGNPAIKTGIESFSHWIGSFAGYLGSPKFATDMETFGTDIGKVASGLENALRWLGRIPTPATQAMPGLPAHQGTVLWPRDAYPNLGSAVYGGFNPFASGVYNGFDFNKIGQFFKVRPALLAAIAGQESNFNPNAVSPKGAQGLFQFMPQTQAAYGVTNPFDATQETEAAGRKLADLRIEYHGDLTKILAAWNWGDGNLNKDVTKNGANWMKYAPKETQNFVAGVQNRVNVYVSNQTGAQVAVVANASGHQ